MTRSKTYVLTAIAALLYVLLGWVFADDLFFGTFWRSDEIASSSLWTWVFLVLIIAAGLWQARELGDRAVDTRAEQVVETPGQTEDPRFWRLLMGNAYYAILWLPVRFFVGQQWLSSGEGKVRDSAWMDGGEALRGYWERVVEVPETGRPAITYAWYRDFLQYMLDNEWYSWFAKLIAIGEVLVGIALIVGALVGIAAFFGTFLNFNFMLAGTASTNPVLFGLSVFLVLAWKVAGYWGLDRYLLPILGAPWKPGPLFRGQLVTRRSGVENPAG